MLQDESGDSETSSVLSDSFLIRIERANDVLERRIGMSCDVEKYGDAMMVGHPLEMPFHLLCGLLFLHGCNYIP